MWKKAVGRREMFLYGEPAGMIALRGRSEGACFRGILDPKEAQNSEISRYGVSQSGTIHLHHFWCILQVFTG